MTTVLRAGRLEAQNAARPGEDGGEPDTGPGASAEASLFSQASRSNCPHWKFVFVSSQIHSSLWSIYFLLKT